MGQNQTVFFRRQTMNGHFARGDTALLPEARGEGWAADPPACAAYLDAA
ncbi:MAG: hypothetical protein IJ684_03560 [Bacteroidales bacterium]|nr:hypothetical protein [Bacteroidales bacterium]